MRASDAAVLALALALFLAPIFAMGEWNVWRFEESVSHLEWDEASQGPAAQAPGAALGVLVVGFVTTLGAAAWAWFGRPT